MSGNGNDTRKRTLIEEGTEFKGSMSSKCPLVVMGKVEGDISGPSVEITSTGIVAGNVKVEELRSEGEIAGSVDARTVHLSGRVRDRTVIRAQTLEVHLSRERGSMEVVFGVCELAIGDEPNKADAIAQALASPKPIAAPPPSVQAPAATDAPAPAPAGDVPAAAESSAVAAAAPAAEEGDWDVSDQPASPEDKSGKRGKSERQHRRTQPPPPT